MILSIDDFETHAKYSNEYRFLLKELKLITL